MKGTHDTIQPVQGSCMSCQSLRHFFHEAKRSLTKLLKYLLAKEEKDANGNLADTDSANSILNVCRWREWATLDFQPWEFLLQFPRTANKLSIDLSVSAELNPQHTVHHLNCWLVILRHDVEIRQIHIFSG